MDVPPKTEGVEAIDCEEELKTEPVEETGREAPPKTEELEVPKTVFDSVDFSLIESTIGAPTAVVAGAVADLLANTGG